jgi:hypothetical protein
LNAITDEFAVAIFPCKVPPWFDNSSIHHSQLTIHNSLFLPNLKEQFPYMKKYVLIASAGLLITAGVTATALKSNGKKKTTTNTSKKCPGHKCSLAANTACY